MIKVTSVAGEGGRERLTDETLFLNGEDVSTKADSQICRC